MQTLYTILLWLTVLIATFFAGATLLAFTKSSFILPKEKGAFLFITLIIAGTAFGAYYLKNQDKLAFASLLLGILWLFLIILIARLCF